jgi:formylglycine-generating enzyme required for sulfatase activity
MRIVVILFALCVSAVPGLTQSLTGFELFDLEIGSFLSDQRKRYDANYPVLSFELDQERFTSIEFPTDRIAVVLEDTTGTYSGYHGKLRFFNASADTIVLRNVVPLGTGSHVHITGQGEHRLSRSHLFWPGRIALNVILPDNAWELGFSAVTINDSLGVAALTRRDLRSLKKGIRRRFETILAPGGSVDYFYYAEFYHGPWQEGLRLIFEERYLYDLAAFDEALFRRTDLEWIRHSYVMHLMMGWDKEVYDPRKGNYVLPDFAARNKALYGGDEVLCIWPTWPTLGLDARNQFDLYRDLPGGLPALRRLSDSLRQVGSRFFVAYNPWDESTRSEAHLAGLQQLLERTGADGVVLDTKGESSRELQEAADKVRNGIVMYSEGMAVPKDMPGIVAGRVHNALYYPPPLNLNKFIRPDFAIFRVAEVFKEPILREYATSFFNGYGTEINQFAAGHPAWEEDQYRFLGRTTRILRENTDVFTKSFTPLLPTKADSLWVNRWGGSEKILYTIYSARPAGFRGVLFEVETETGFHFVDLWNHRDLKPIPVDAKVFVEVAIDGFETRWLGTNNEGAVGCIARFKSLLNVRQAEGRVVIQASEGDEIRVWSGSPSYTASYRSLKPGEHSLPLNDVWGRTDDKVVIQLMQNGLLVDQSVLEFPPGQPHLVSAVERTAAVAKAPPGMVRIPAGRFTFRFTQGDDFIRYPREGQGENLEMPTYFMDKHPVTNAQFAEFLARSNYQPADTTSFLRHWPRRAMPAELANFPVVYVSYEDATAYAAWSGKRLPTEAEWQYGAQTPALNEWPWKQVKPVTRKNQYVTETLTVSKPEGISPKLCNLGDGQLYAVGRYPAGQNPYGLQDLVGCVWQLTNDMYESSSYRFIIMKGGSYFNPTSSWWYVQGGPRELHYRQMLLRVSQGFERNATVGFRCVADAVKK